MTVSENVQFLRDRITALQFKKNVSEYKVSQGIGKSNGYINSITSGKILPSFQEFFSICNYFEISPRDFFDTGEEESPLLARLKRIAEQMTPETLMYLIDYAEWLLKKGSSDDCKWIISPKE